ncbi:MFS transporter [Streptomyces sp. SID3343]|uniref:MFS transporter n=1 Tax=Streptomyces sp. SID3343 TaxID=2690260 RepID=UPI001370B1CC|nr:MFS transporter [Streptomyces sp. SID3343]MYW01642.1 hypothetical protein [Streptomyces sp. SID3343]
MDISRLPADARDRRRAEIREFLRSRRARVTPEEMGMPAGSGRRTPGLRREEVAVLAGVGVSFEGPARTRVFAAVGIVTGAGLAMGAMAAGALADALGWRAFFGLHAILISFVILLPLLPNYLLVSNGSSSRSAGVTMLWMTLPILLTPLLAGRLVRWGLSTRAVFGLSLVCLTTGVAWLAAVLRPGVDTATLAGPLIVLGAGVGLNFGLVDGAVLTVVAPEATGTAAGFLNTVRLGSEAVVIAAAGSALVNVTRARLDDDLGAFPAYRGSAGGLVNSVNAGDLTGPLSELPPGIQPAFTDFVTHGLTDAWQAVLWVSAAVCAVLSVAIHRMLAEPRRKTSAGDEPHATPNDEPARTLPSRRPSKLWPARAGGNHVTTGPTEPQP